MYLHVQLVCTYLLHPGANRILSGPRSFGGDTKSSPAALLEVVPSSAEQSVQWCWLHLFPMQAHHNDFESIASAIPDYMAAFGICWVTGT